MRRRLLARWAASPPGVFVGVDAPDFNLGLERRLRARGVPTVHYVSPSVWAWRRYRVRKVARAVDRLLVLFPCWMEHFVEPHNSDVPRITIAFNVALATSLLTDPDPAVRYQAVKALLRQRARGVRSKVAALLDDTEPDVRTEAEKALAKLPE